MARLTVLTYNLSTWGPVDFRTRSSKVSLDFRKTMSQQMNELSSSEATMIGLSFKRMSEKNL